MSNTRRAGEGGAFRQERFASSQEYERGLMANLVAKRCSVLERAEDRQLIWFIQLVSHRSGGIKKLATDLLAQFPDRIASASMRKFGVKPGQIYSASQVKKIRAELSCSFPLKGEFCEEETDLLLLSDEELRKKRELLEFEARFHPLNYPASEFVKCCKDAATAGLEKHLLSLCLDPALQVANGTPWYFPTLIATLREVQSKWISEHSAGAVTSICEKIARALDYAMESRRLIIIDGLPRIGKSHGAKSWCNLHPGRVRYVECPSSNDDFSFFRSIAESLGVSINLKSKAQELRNRIEETLQGGDLALVIDEAHYLWPQSHYRNTTPVRINWLMTALVNHGVAVSLVTTPQFFRSQQAIEKATCWTSEQFIGRIGHYEKLPDSLSTDDLTKVALALLPGGSADSVKALVLYAQSSRKYLAGIDAIVTRARFTCQKDGRQKVEFRDVKRAIQESVIPSDTALTGAIESVSTVQRKRVARVFAEPLQEDSRPSESSLPVGRLRRRTVRPALAAETTETEFTHA
jgi:AAA domain-containing protein